MVHRLKFIFALCVAIAVLATPDFDSESGPSLSLATPAQAQERPKTLLDLLFKRQQRAKQKKVRSIKRTNQPRRVVGGSKKRSASKKRSTKKRAVASQTRKTVPTVPKAENARRVLVVGDFMADGMAQGLVQAYDQVATVVIEKRVNGSSGLVRDDYFDWIGQIPSFIEETKPDIVLVLLGSNDRQAMRVNGSTAKVRSEAWDKEYERRTQEFAKAIRAGGVLPVWVGSPSFRFKSMSADMLAFNDFYRSSVESVGGRFVDVWDGFVDDQGKFITVGSDIKGQNVQLRASDGINFTRAGKRKLAFYAERELKRILGDDAAPLLGALGGQSVPILQLPPLEAESELVRTNPIGILDPDFDGGSALLGDVTAVPVVAANPLQVRSVRQQLVEEGRAPPSQAGRADNFRWQSPQTTSAVVQP